MLALQPLFAPRFPPFRNPVVAGRASGENESQWQNELNVSFAVVAIEDDRSTEDVSFAFCRLVLIHPFREHID